MVIRKGVGDLSQNQLQGRKVLVRVDFDVRLQYILNTVDVKLTAALPTIRHLIDRGAKVILCSHLGSPNGVTDECSLRHLLPRLRSLIRTNVEWADDCIGEQVKSKVDLLPNGGVLLLENLKFHKEEEQNNIKFAQKLASLADLYVDEAFRFPNYASTDAITKYFPLWIAGFLRQKVFPLSGKTKMIHPEVAEFTDLPPMENQIPPNYLFDGRLDCSLLSSTLSAEQLAAKDCTPICCLFPIQEGEDENCYHFTCDASFRGKGSAGGGRAGLGAVGRNHTGRGFAYVAGVSSELRDIYFHETESMSVGLDFMAAQDEVKTLRAFTDNYSLYKELNGLFRKGFNKEDKMLLKNSEAGEASNEDPTFTLVKKKKKPGRQAGLPLKVKAKIVKLRHERWPGARFSLNWLPREQNYSADMASRDESSGLRRVLVRPGVRTPADYFIGRDLRSILQLIERYLQYGNSYSFVVQKKLMMEAAARRDR